MRAPPRAGNKSVWLITPLALHQKPRGGWVLQQRHPVLSVFNVIKKTLTTTGIEPVCCFCEQQSNVVAYLRRKLRRRLRRRLLFCERPAHYQTGAQARDNVLDMHKEHTRNTRNTIHFRVVVHVLVDGIDLCITCVVCIVAV